MHVGRRNCAPSDLTTPHDLNPYQNKYTIQARVVKKNNKGEEKDWRPGHASCMMDEGQDLSTAHACHQDAKIVMTCVCHIEPVHDSCMLGDETALPQTLPRLMISQIQNY